jgi:hypothetical protein
MPARMRNFIIEKGADFLRVLGIADAEGDLLNMTGGGYSAELKIVDDTGATLLELTTAAEGGIELGNGEITIDVDKAITDALSLAALLRSGTINEPAPNDSPDYVAFGALANYDFWLHEPDGRDSRLLKGTICFAGFE